MTIAERKANLEAKLSQVVGSDVEITFRADGKFTLSTETVDQDLEFHLVQFFGDAMKVEAADIDEECGTFVYMVAA